MAASLLCYLSAWRLNQGICAWKAWKFPFWTRCQNFIWSKQFIGHFPGNRKGWMQIGSLTPDSSISNTCRESWEDRAKTNQPSLLILKGRIFLLVDFKNCSTLPCHVYTYLLPATSEETVISSFLKFSIVSVLRAGNLLAWEANLEARRLLPELFSLSCLRALKLWSAGAEQNHTWGADLQYLHLCVRE